MKFVEKIEQGEVEVVIVSRLPSSFTYDVPIQRQEEFQWLTFRRLQKRLAT